MQAGKLRHRLAIQSPTEIIVRGEPSVTWNTVATRWAQIEPLTGRELWNARQVQPDITHRIELRHDSSILITSKWRLLLNGTRVLEILSVRRPEERPTNWVIECKEAV
jgi:SPP1 family predicted phage head-tail adaptor